MFSATVRRRSSKRALGRSLVALGVVATAVLVLVALAAPSGGTPGLPLAFVAGILSFLSPCCLPLVPGYLATVTGATPQDKREGVDREVIARSLLFIATFSVVFILIGLTATALGQALLDNRDTLNTVAGVAILAMGGMLIASLFITALNREWRPQGLIERAGRGGPVVAGAAFSIAWTPCVGPTLGAILGLAATTSGAAHGALLLGAYSAGLGLPFFLSAVAFDRTSRAFARVRRHYLAVQGVAGVILIAMGVLVVTGELFQLNIRAQRLLSDLGLDFFYNL